MFVVMTKVNLKPGKIDEVKSLFADTNPGLVEGQEDWLKAEFTANREQDQVTVLAYWQRADSYRAFSQSEEFKSVMAEFGKYFESPPEVTVNEVLYSM